MAFLKEYFIGDYLREEADALKQASVKLIFNVIRITIFSLMIIFIVDLINGFFYQMIKSLIIRKTSNTFWTRVLTTTLPNPLIGSPIGLY